MTTSGICQRTIAGIKAIFEHDDSIRGSAILCIDGMKLQSGLQYLANDKISGYEELGKGIRTPNVANELIVIMAQGLAERWRQVGHFAQIS